MKENNKKLIMPSAEIIAEMVELTDSLAKYEKGMKIEDMEKKSERYEELTDKYDFFDRIFEEDGKKGLKDIRGQVVVPAMYKDFCMTYRYDTDRFMPVGASKDGKHFALVKTDGTGEPLSEFKYDLIRLIPWSSAFAVLYNKKIGIIASNGKELLKPIADSYTEPMNEIIVYKSEGKSGLITLYGTYVPPIYDDIDDKDDMVYAKLGDKHGFIDEDGNFVEDLGDDSCFDAPLLYWIEN